MADPKGKVEERSVPCALKGAATLGSVRMRRASGQGLVWTARER